MPLSPIYRRSSEVSASYDWQDIASGSGYITFYGTADKNASGTSYGLIEETVYSNPYYTAVAQGNTSDVDYDITFNSPRTIEGNCYCNVTFGVKNNSAPESATIEWELYKVVGVTETLIGEITSETLTINNDTDVYACTTQLLKISASKTTFGVGDKLRMTMKLVAGASDGSAGAIYYHDPAGRTDAGATTTQLSYHIPFRIDV